MVWWYPRGSNLIPGCHPTDAGMLQQKGDINHPLMGEVHISTDKHPHEANHLFPGTATSLGFLLEPRVLSRRHNNSESNSAAACMTTARAYNPTARGRHLTPGATTPPPLPPTASNRSNTPLNRPTSSVITPSTPLRTAHSIHPSSLTVHTNSLRPRSRTARRKRAPSGPTRLGWNRLKCTSACLSERKRRA